MIDKQKVKEILDKKNEAYKAWSGALEEMYEDFEFYHSKQWSDADVNALNKRGQAALTINLIKKIVNLVSGLQRQNKAGIGLLPIEQSDEMTTEVISRVLKWILKQQSFEHKWSASFKDCVIGGLGWFKVDMDYSKDPLNGDIVGNHINLMDVLTDPNFNELDLSDCQYIIYHKEMEKGALKALYPDYEEEIDQCKNRVDDSIWSRFKGQKTRIIKKIPVIEYWHRKYEYVYFIVDEEKNLTRFDGKEKERKVLEKNGTNIVKRKIGRIYLTITVGDNVIVYDGLNPLEVDTFPFIPLFGWYSASFTDWEYRVEGVVRDLKDINREKNKRRSQISAAVNKMPHSGFLVEENSIKDEGHLKNIGGKGGQIIKYRTGRRPPTPFAPPQIPSSLIQLEQALTQDINQVGVNPDLLGYISESGTAGVTVQLRQKQGMTALQEIFDNQSQSLRNLGYLIVQLIVANFSQEKIVRILGDDFVYQQQLKQLIQQREQIKEQTAKLIQGVQDVQGIGQDEEQQAKAAQVAVQQLENAAMDVEQRIQAVQQEEKEFWMTFDDYKTNMRYDCVVDEQANSPTYRYAAREQLQQFAQSGFPVSPKVLIELSEIPKTVKDKLFAYIDQQEQAQQQARQEELQVRQQKLQVEAMKAQAGMSGKQDDGIN